MTHNQDKKNVAVPRKPRSQQYFITPRNTQKNNYNQYKYSKNTLNEQWFPTTIIIPVISTVLYTMLWKNVFFFF